LAASSIVSSFLGATAIGRDGLSGWGVVALGGLAVSLALCVAILLPRSELSFSIDGPRVYEDLYELRSDALFISASLTTCGGDGSRTNGVGACPGGDLTTMAEKSTKAPPPPPPTPGIFLPEKLPHTHGAREWRLGRLSLRWLRRARRAAR
jgi:hypothetical protein